MKDIKFIRKNQNVYIQYTGAGSRVFTELYCIATDEDNANRICNALNYTSDHIEEFANF